MSKSLDDRVMELVRSLDAEKATVSMTFDKDSWWTRRGKGTDRHFTVEIEWGETNTEKRRVVGIARSFDGAVEDVQASVAGLLAKGAFDE